MRDEPNAEAGLYPFDGCCEHLFRVHSAKACQMSGCSCRRRRQLPKPPLENPPRVMGDAVAGKNPAAEIVATLQPDGWWITHEVFTNGTSSLVVTRVHRPNGDLLTEAVWDPDTSP